MKMETVREIIRENEQEKGEGMNNKFENRSFEVRKVLQKYANMIIDSWGVADATQKAILHLDKVRTEIEEIYADKPEEKR